MKSLSAWEKENPEKALKIGKRVCIILATGALGEGIVFAYLGNYQGSLILDGGIIAILMYQAYHCAAEEEERRDGKTTTRKNYLICWAPCVWKIIRSIGKIIYGLFIHASKS